MSIKQQNVPDLQEEMVISLKEENKKLENQYYEYRRNQEGIINRLNQQQQLVYLLFLFVVILVILNFCCFLRIIGVEERIIGNNNQSSKQIVNIEEQLANLNFNIEENNVINNNTKILQQQLSEMNIQNNKKITDIEDKLIEKSEFDQVVENLDELNCLQKVGLKVDQKCLMLQSFDKLNKSIQILENPEHIKFILYTIQEKNLARLNPQSIIKFNPKRDGISIEDFRNKIKGFDNCLFILKVKEHKDSEYEYYGGFAPYSIVYDNIRNKTKTEKTEEYNLPYTFDLNTKVIRKCINLYSWKDHNQDMYFHFTWDIGVLDKSDDYRLILFYFDQNYKSQFEEENKNQKRYKQQIMEEIEIEVIRLF